MYMIIYFKISIRTWTIHRKAYRLVACKIRTVFSPFRQHCLRFQQQEQEQDRSPSTVVVAVRDNACPKPTRLSAQGHTRRAKPCRWHCCPFLSRLAFCHTVQVHVSYRVKNTRNFVPLNSPNSLLVKEWISLQRQALWVLFTPKPVFLRPKIKHKPKTNVPPIPNPRRPSSRDSS